MSKPIVLFVDDEPNLLDGLKRFSRTKRSEWDLKFALGGEEALELFQSHNIDVLVTDMRMPGLDGADLTQRVSEKSPGTMRIILSGEADVIQAYRTIGRSHRFIAKPCDPSALLEVIEQLLHCRDQAGWDMAKEMGSVYDRLVVRRDTFNALNAELEQADTKASSVAKIISRDANLAARVLQIVNSAYFGRPLKTSNILRALESLGLERVRDLLENGRFGVVPDLDTVSTLQQEATYTLHELATLARDEVGARNGSPDEQCLAFALGLFCSLGRRHSNAGEAYHGDKYLAGNTVVFTSELLGLPAELTDRLQHLTAQRVDLSSKEGCVQAISQSVLAKNLNAA